MTENRLLLVIMCLVGLGGCYLAAKHSPANNSVTPPKVSPFVPDRNKQPQAPPPPQTPPQTPPTQPKPEREQSPG